MVGFSVKPDWDHATHVITFFPLPASAILFHFFLFFRLLLFKNPGCLRRYHRWIIRLCNDLFVAGYGKRWGGAGYSNN
jgi:hypothetical protein